jgi:hypothetical protein
MLPIAAEPFLTRFEDVSKENHPVLIKWLQTAETVFVTGSFCAWAAMVPLQFENDLFFVVLRLPEGQHSVKFIVDGLWKHDHAQPSSTDENGNVNNIIVVAPGDDVTGPSSSF